MAVNTAIRCFEPLGANFYQADTVMQFRLGEQARGENGSRWEYVQNTSTTVKINAYECVGYNSDYKAAAVASSATSDAAKFRNCAWPQIDIPASGFGWVVRACSGGAKGKAAASVGANVQMWVGKNGTSAGVLTAASGTNAIKVFGAVLVTAIGSTGTNTAELIADFPRFGVTS